MSDPTYRIDTEWDAHTGVWFSRITRLSDLMILDSVFDSSKHGALEKSKHGALEKALAWIVRETRSRDERTTVYVDDDGRPVEGHSVKAS